PVQSTPTLPTSLRSEQAARLTSTAAIAAKRNGVVGMADLLVAQRMWGEPAGCARAVVGEKYAGGVERFHVMSKRLEGRMPGVAFMVLLAVSGFAANSVLARLALGTAAIDAAGYTAIRL